MISFGLIALFYPASSILTLASLFGILLLAGGIILTLNYIAHRQYTNTWLWLTEGVLDIILGIIIFAHPAISAKIFLGIMGIWAIFMAMVMLFYFSRLEYEGMGRYLALAASVISLLFGILVLINPFESAKFMVSFIGLYAIFYGVVTLFKVPRQRENA